MMSDRVHVVRDLRTAFEDREVAVWCDDRRSARTGEEHDELGLAVRVEVGSSDWMDDCLANKTHDRIIGAPTARRERSRRARAA
jgi:hypothetical protein